MGGHAFPHLHCPRMPPDLYSKVRQQTTVVLRSLFKHVVVPTELPSKSDYGDIDFLVSAPLLASSTVPFDWPTMVTTTKLAFHTPHGRRGHLNPSVIYCAIPAPGIDNDHWVQVDIQICERAEMFDWMRFQLNYASALKLVGSMIKPLGMNINPEGLHLRVEEMEKTDMPGSMVFLTKEPKDVLKIVGLDRRVMNAEFKTNEELYEYFASSWLFNPAHFAERLKSEKFAQRLEDRSAPWVYFVTTWIPQHYPGYRFSDLDSMTDQPSGVDLTDLQVWYHNTRTLIREKAFTMFPSAASVYYQKRQTHLKEVEEQRLRSLLMSVLPSNNVGWSDKIPQPRIIIKPSIPSAPELKPRGFSGPSTLHIPTEVFTPPSSPIECSQKIFDSPSSSTSSHSSSDSVEDHLDTLSPKNTPLYLEPLVEMPPTGSSCTPRPPPATMSLEARLLCLARWTLFDPMTGSPYLAREPREKKFVMAWAECEAPDSVLVTWATEMWWPIWVRQCHVNYVGMWERKFEKALAKKMQQHKEEGECRLRAEKTQKEDTTAIVLEKKSIEMETGDKNEEVKAHEADIAQMEVKASEKGSENQTRMEKILERLRKLNERLEGLRP